MAQELQNVKKGEDEIRSFRLRILLKPSRVVLSGAGSSSFVDLSVKVQMAGGCRHDIHL